MAEAIKQAGGTDGAKMKDALENLNSAVNGAMKTYNKPFSKTNHEALMASDLAFVKWSNDQLVQHSDNIIKSMSASDYKR